MDVVSLPTYSRPLQEVKANPLNYDAWFDYLRLVESEGDKEVIRETYERAIANVPPLKVGFLSKVNPRISASLEIKERSNYLLYIFRRRDTGGGTFTCGSTTRSGKR
jgi:hypothetical protein